MRTYNTIIEWEKIGRSTIHDNVTDVLRDVRGNLADAKKIVIEIQDGEEENDNVDS